MCISVFYMRAPFFFALWLCICMHITITQCARFIIISLINNINCFLSQPFNGIKSKISKTAKKRKKREKRITTSWSGT